MNLQKILGNIRRADNDYHLFEPHDRIAVGISGGKDSMVLLASLNQLKNFSDYDFEIIAIHIDEGFLDMNFSEIDSYCQSHGIQLYHETTKIYETLLKDQKNGKLSCSRCSKYKKACMVQAALKYKCNKIAFAHHGDDAIETFFMNMMHNGKIAVFQPKIKMEKSSLVLIRPLIYTFEKEIAACAERLKLPTVTSTCPNDHQSLRAYTKKSLNALYQNHPSVQHNFLYMLNNLENVNLWKKEK